MSLYFISIFQVILGRSARCPSSWPLCTLTGTRCRSSHPAGALWWSAPSSPVISWLASPLRRATISQKRYIATPHQMSLPRCCSLTFFFSVRAGGAEDGEWDQEDPRDLQSYVWPDLQTTGHHRVGVKPPRCTHLWQIPAGLVTISPLPPPPCLSSVQHSHWRQTILWWRAHAALLFLITPPWF